MMLAKSRTLALAAIAALITAAALVSFAQSFRGLYEWADHHGLAGSWALAWPLMVDVFIGVGELALFVALVDRWPARSRTAAWLVTLTGLAVSVAGNVGHEAASPLSYRLTAAVPPLAAAAALAVGLGVLKRVVGSQARSELAVAQDGPVQEMELSARELARKLGVSRRQAARRLGQSWAGPAPMGQAATVNGHGRHAAGSTS